MIIAHIIYKATFVNTMSLGKEIHNYKYINVIRNNFITSYHLHTIRNKVTKDKLTSLK